MVDGTHTPSGNYPAHARAQVIDLETAADRLVAKLPGTRRQTENLAREAGSSVLMMAMEAGDQVQEHSAPGVVSIHVVRGHATVTAEGEAFSLRPGQLALLQPGVRHDVRAESQSVLVLVVSGG